MLQLKVIVNKLNKRKSPVSDFSIKNIVGTVNKDYTFEGEEVAPLTGSSDKWYKDRDGSFYWGGGISIVSIAPAAPTLPSTTATPAQGASRQFTFRQQGKGFLAATAGVEFFVGYRVSYLGRIGLSNNVATGPVYKPENYEEKHGYWAYFIYPTAICESRGSFHCLNTYDTAAFTFTFMQFAAHVSNGDFVKYMRDLLSLPAAKEYFPSLKLVNGHLFNNDKQLEDSNSTSALMNFLNSNGNDIDDNELNAAARFVHWAQNDPAHRDLQVSIAVDHFKENMKDYAKKYGLDGFPDYICHAIADIRHQGRAKSVDIQSTINRNKSDFKTMHTGLLALGGKSYKERVDTLSTEHAKLIASGKFGKKKYSISAGDFIVL